MTGFPLIIIFILAIILMIVLISKFKIHPFISIMLVSLILGLLAGIPIADVKLEDGSAKAGIATVIGQGFSGTFTSIGIVIILGALIGSILEQTGAALKLADIDMDKKFGDIVKIYQQRNKYLTDLNKANFGGFAEETLRAYLEEPKFLGGRHETRVNKIKAYEEKVYK